MIGYGAVVAALLVTVLAVILFFMASSRKQAGKQRLSSWARSLYIFSTMLIGVTAFYLMYILLSNRFEYAYVVSYSSRDLPLAYKVSAFWAGQEGSLMLWLVFHAAFGLVLLRKQSTVLPVLAVYSLVQAAFLGLLIVKSPFMILAEQHINGVGLNFLLRDPWMVIHPPILFMGYAALAVPFSYGMGAMLKERHQVWLDAASVWTLLVLSSLGAGMFIGGFWAYKVLGWGGYWAWDPVENSSLVPWIAAVAVVHLICLAKVRAGAIKYAYAGVIVSFILMVYGTFLTRSGVLSDFSTHSFSDEGIGGFLGLLVIITAYAAWVVYIIKWPGMPAGELYPGIVSREFVLLLTALILALFGMLVLVGTSIPLVTTALGSPKGVSSAFYNHATLPLAVAIGVLLIAGALVKWKNGSYSGRQVGWLGLFLIGGLMLAWWLNLYQPYFIAILCLALAAVATNSYAAFTRHMSCSAACSHIGAAILMIGIIASGAASQSATVSLAQGQSQKVFDYQISYSGAELDPAGKEFYKIFHVGPNKVTALTKLDKQGMPLAREPAIYRSLFADVYITPNATEQADTGQKVILVKGQPFSQNGITLNFIKLTLEGMDGISEARVQAIIEVLADSQTQWVRPELVSKNGQIIGTTAIAFERYQLQITSFRPGGNQLVVEFKDTKGVGSTEPVYLEAEISTKPLINLVWLGALLLTIGTGWSGIKKFNSINNSRIGNLIDKSSVDL